MSLVSEKSDDFGPQLRALIQNLRTVDSSSGSIDCSPLDWVSPLTLLPLAAYIHTKKKMVAGLGSYLQTVRFPDGADQIGGFQMGQAYLPIARFATKSIPHVEQFTNHFAQIVLQSLGPAGEHLRNAWFYAIAELVTNIAEHSQSSLGWLSAQYWPAKGFLDAVVLDQGRGFRKTYEEAYGKTYTHQEAIRLALEGRSVKNDIERGKGLHTTKNLVTQSPINGKFLIISGNCGYYADSQKQTWLNLGTWQWDGAIVAFRINRVNKPVNIYPYVE